MAGMEMPGQDDNNQQQQLADDPISRAIGATLGETGEDIDPAGGGEGKKPEDNQQQQDAGQGSDSNNPNNNQQQATDQKGKKDEKQAGAANNGDLTLQDGTVIKGGAERRHYEGRKLAEQQLSMRTNELNQMTQSRDSFKQKYEQLNSTVQSLHGADPAQVTTGLKIVRDLTRDPAGTLKALLTEAVAAGYTVEGIAQGIDVQSIRQSLEAKFAPFAEQMQQMQTQQQSEQEVEQEVQQFFTAHPDAVVHDELIAAVMQKNPSLSLSDAYYQLRMSANDRGLDWSKPLVPQLTSAQQQQPNNQQQQKQAPMPNGRSPAQPQQAQNADKVVVAPESTDMGSIVKQAMRENGLNI